MRKKEVARKDILNFRLFGEFCRICRKRCKMTQAEVGTLLGYSANHLSDFERGEVDSFYLAYSYAMLFGATIFNYIQWCEASQLEIYTPDLAGLFKPEYKNGVIELGDKSYFLIEERNAQALKALYTQKEMGTNLAIKKEKAMLNAIYGKKAGEVDGLSTTDNKAE